MEEKKKRILIGAITSIIIFTFLIFCYIFLPRNIFILVLLSGIILSMLFEMFVSKKKDVKDGDK